MKKLLLILLCLPMIGFGQKTGCISGDCKNGYGTYVFGKGVGEGDKYVGEWKNYMYHGQGTYTYVWGLVKGNKYVGEWKNHKKNGQGTYIWVNGNEYVGEFKDGIMHGQGTMTYAVGTIEEGLWENGKFLGEE